jgi:hypothetical protein
VAQRHSAVSAHRQGPLRARHQPDTVCDIPPSPSHSKRIEAHSQVILGLVAETPDITLVGIRATLADRGVRVGIGTLWRFFHDHAQKKTAHATEQDRPDILKRRKAWFDGQLDLDPTRLVFIDETAASTKMARLRNRRSQAHRHCRSHGTRRTDDR